MTAKDILGSHEPFVHFGRLDRIELKQKIIVGQPSWPTPLLSAKMQFIIFHPSWGMPDGIKAKELLPRLRQASGNSGFGFFDQLFGGAGYSGATAPG